ncbi:hypothetical protein WS68_16465 [Burkholderia sp. TSV86]|nr:hypothetical protein WS68_16465 [Burkholderia sp. TSV86]
MGSPAHVADRSLDLVMIGTHGRRGVLLLLGSVAERFMRGSSCPVLLMRGDDPVSTAAAMA